jgi:WD40 repeat protein
VEFARMTNENIVSSVAFSPDGKYVVSGSWDHTARVWEATTGVEVARMTHESRVTSVAFSPESKYVVSGSGWDIMDSRGYGSTTRADERIR